ncbi:hypothetical protein AB1I63_00360 [Streptococcus pneumoniae]
MQKKKVCTDVIIMIAQIVTGMLALYNAGYLFGEYLAGVPFESLSWRTAVTSLVLASVMFMLRMGGKKDEK